MNINPDHCEIREVPIVETGGVRVIATVRYAVAIEVLGERIQDFGEGIIELAKSQALARLLEDPIPVRLGEHVTVIPLDLPTSTEVKG